MAVAGREHQRGIGLAREVRTGAAFEQRPQQSRIPIAGGDEQILARLRCRGDHDKSRDQQNAKTLHGPIHLQWMRCRAFVSFAWNAAPAEMKLS
jgi:hypothetical protein